MAMTCSCTGTPACSSPETEAGKGLEPTWLCAALSLDNHGPALLGLSLGGWGHCWLWHTGVEEKLPSAAQALLGLWRPGQGHFNSTSFCEVRGALSDWWRGGRIAPGRLLGQPGPGFCYFLGRLPAVQCFWRDHVEVGGNTSLYRCIYCYIMYQRTIYASILGGAGDGCSSPDLLSHTEGLD